MKGSNPLEYGSTIYGVESKDRNFVSRQDVNEMGMVWDFEIMD